MFQRAITTIVLSLLMLFALTSPASAIGSQSVTMTVGETKTFYLPSSVTSLKLRSSVFYAASPAYADVKSYSMYSVTIVAKKPTPSAPVVVRCDYKYTVSSGNFNYGASGGYDFLVTVVGKNPTRITLPETETLYVGESLTLKPTIEPADAYTELTWSSSAYSTINVDQNGRLLAQREGTSVITVQTKNGLKAYCTVTAKTRTVDPSSIKVSPTALTLTIGDTQTLTATVSPTNATDKTVYWSSLYPDVATVSAGKVTAIKEGKTIVTAKTVNGLSATCLVTVVLPTLKITGTSEILNVPALANVDYNRSFLKGWNSLCVPFGLTETELDAVTGVKGCRIAKFKEAKASSFLFEYVDAVEGGMPCLVYFPEEATVSIKKERVVLAKTPIQTSAIIGSYTTKTIGPGYYKLNPEGKAFGLTTQSDAYIKASRVYIKQQ